MGHIVNLRGPMAMPASESGRLRGAHHDLHLVESLQLLAAAGSTAGLRGRVLLCVGVLSCLSPPVSSEAEVGEHQKKRKTRHT